MTRRFWTVEIRREHVETAKDEDMMYHGSDVNSVYDSILKIIDSKTAAYEIIGEAIVTGRCEYRFSWTSKDEIVVESFDDDDGSGETMED